MNEIGFSGGEKDFEGTPLMNGGRIREHSAETDHEFTATLYPVEAGAGTGANRPGGFHELLYGSADSAGTDEGSKYEVSLNRDDYRIAVLWTNDDNVTSQYDTSGSMNGALSTVAADKAGVRKVMRNAQLTSGSLNFDDMVLTAEVTFKAAPFDETQSKNVYVESCPADGTESMPTVDDGGTYDSGA
jgi:hypothetical protein